jgi:hypothetical protein
MGAFMKTLLLSILVISGVSVTRLSSLCQEESFSDELAADEYGIYHVVISDDEEKEAFSQIPQGAKVVYHNADELRDSFRIARESGKFEELEPEELTEEFLKIAPPINFEKGNENFDGTHHTHCSQGETVSTWWNRNTPARPGKFDGVEDHIYLIFRQNAHPWWNYVIVRNWGSECTMEAYLIYNTANDTPNFTISDGSCNPPPTGSCAGQAGVGSCGGTVSKNTLLNGYISNISDGTHTFPAVYAVVNEFYVPDENATYPYNNEVWLYRFSTSTWIRVHQRYHNTRPLIGTSGQDRAFWIEYWYENNGGPECTGQTHPDIGFMNYNHCKVRTGKMGTASGTDLQTEFHSCQTIITTQ